MSEVCAQVCSALSKSSRSVTFQSVPLKSEFDACGSRCLSRRSEVQRRSQ
jgi:hypothetical protein